MPFPTPTPTCTSPSPKDPDGETAKPTLPPDSNTAKCDPDSPKEEGDVIIDP